MKAQDLKNSILQLAIQGKLVPQNLNDESAEVLYAKIQAEKQKLIKEGKIKKDKPLPLITDDEIPFPIPSTWKWVRLTSLCDIYTGNSISENVKLAKYTNLNSGYNYIGTKDVKFDNTINYENGIKISFNEEKFRYAYPDDTLLCIEGGSAGRKIAVLSEQVCFGNKLCNFHQYINETRYLYYLLQSPYFLSIFKENITGIIGGVSVNKIKELFIPLPPLAEQKRIVAKIEELEPLIKQYNKAETELSALNDSFPEQLKKSILQYAIQGKLVSQDANDEPAEVLYAKIQAEKQKLIKEGKIKKDKPLPLITDDEIPFSIPPSWKWVRLGDVGESRIGLTYHPEDVSDNGVIVLRSSNIQNSKLAFDDVVRVDTTIPDNLLVNKGNIIICARNGSKALVGKSAIIDKIEEPMTFGAFMAIYKSPVNEFVKIYLDSPLFKSTLDAVNTVTINQITQKNLNNAIIPLPPLAEQRRIVAKVNELMQYCEKLKI